MYQFHFSLPGDINPQVFRPSATLQAGGSLGLVLRIPLTFLLCWILCFLNLLSFSFVIFYLVFVACIFQMLPKKGCMKGNS